MEQINIKVANSDAKQAFVDLVENWRNGDESNGDVFNRIVSAAKAMGQKPIEVTESLGNVRNTVDTLMHQINAAMSSNVATIEDLRNQLAEKDEKIEELDNDYKKKLLQMGDDHREKVEKLKTNIDELKDWLAVATQSKAQSEKQLKDATVALQSCQDNLNDKKALIDKLNDDLNDRNNKIVELQSIVDQSQEKLASELRKVAEKHQAEVAKAEKRHQFELEQQRMQVAAELEKVKAEHAAEKAQALEKKTETLHQEFAEERKELQEKLDKKQELLDNLKDQLSSTRENNAVLKQQLSQFTHQG